jgi:DNA-directed RNA polymerase specialized sigma24 family protein
VPALRLHDVDVERLAGAIVAQSGLELSYHDKQDLRQHLLIEAWRLSLSYEPGRIRLGFRKYAALTLKKRVIDWQRQQNGGRTIWKFKDRVYERELPQLLSLDTSGLGDALGSWTGDPAANWDETCGRLVAGRDRFRARDLAAIRRRCAR